MSARSLEAEEKEQEREVCCLGKEGNNYYGCDENKTRGYSNVPSKTSQMNTTPSPYNKRPHFAKPSTRIAFAPPMNPTGDYLFPWTNLQTHFLHMAPTLLITIESAWPQKPARTHPLLLSGGSCSTTFIPSGGETFPWPYAFQLVSSWPVVSSTTSAAIQPESGIHSTLTFVAVACLKSASGCDQNR